MRPSLTVQIIQIVVVAVTLVGGIMLRFQPMPYRVLGGGLIAIAVLLLVIWGKRAARPQRDPNDR